MTTPFPCPAERPEPGRLDRRRFLEGLAWGVGLSLLQPSQLLRAGETPPRDAPNVVLVCSDQHRWQSMSFTEMPRLQTPNMERMAAEGCSFDRTISNYPVCSPARAMLMTGRWPHQTGVLDNSLKEEFVLSAEERTMADAFATAGYATGFIGKWHLGGYSTDLASYGYQDSTVWFRTNKHWDSFFHTNGGDREHSQRYNATHMTDQALSFMQRKRERPFFLTLMWNPPHSNFMDPPAALMKMYEGPDGLPFRDNVEAADGRPEETFGARYWGYHAHVTAIDAELGRLLRAADARPNGRDTIVVYTSDHGGMVSSRGVFGKRYPYAEAIRVPFLVRWPGSVAAGSRVADPVGTIDLLPTLCGIAGVRAPEGCAGIDVSAAAFGRTGQRPGVQPIMHLQNAHSLNDDIYPTRLFRGVATDRYTYAIDEDGPWLLFDDASDPLQTSNLVSSTDHARIRETLHQQTVDWLRLLGDSFPTGEGGASRKSAGSQGGDNA